MLPSHHGRQPPAYVLEHAGVVCLNSYAFRLRYMAFSRHFYPKRLIICTLSEEEKQQYIAVGAVRMFIECQALTIVRLTHSLYTTNLARIRCSTMLITIFKLKDREESKVHPGLTQMETEDSPPKPKAKHERSLKPGYTLW